MRRIETHWLLSHPPHEVWAVLVDFNAYADWNPLNVWAQGSARQGARVAMKFTNPGRPGAVIAQDVIITEFVPERRLEWVGRIPLLFTGRHYFRLDAVQAGTGLVHGECLSGLVPAFWSPARLEAQRAAYERMNQALERHLNELAKH